MPRRLLAPLVAALAIASLAGCQAGALAPEAGQTQPGADTGATAPPADGAPSLPPMPQLCGELDGPGTAAAAGAAGFVPNAQEWESADDSWNRGVALPEASLTCAWSPTTAGDDMVVVDVIQVDEAQLEAWTDAGEWSATTIDGHEVRSDLDSDVDDVGAVGTTWAVSGDRMLRVTAIGAVATGTAIAEALVPSVLG